jgi:hypothetical protein
MMRLCSWQYTCGAAMLVFLFPVMLLHDWHSKGIVMLSSSGYLPERVNMLSTSRYPP